ncbi:hypothetical protein Cal7507_2992 [Calothrix sp. PCC 7507]|nr:hypothetical protein Cal7507_2992 [Calothrix sp. PCC 7507]
MKVRKIVEREFPGLYQFKKRIRQMGRGTAPINYRFSRKSMEAVPVRRMYVLQTLFELVLGTQIKRARAADSRSLIQLCAEIDIPHSALHYVIQEFQVLLHRGFVDVSPICC